MVVRSAVILVLAVTVTACVPGRAGSSADDASSTSRRYDVS